MPAFSHILTVSVLLVSDFPFTIASGAEKFWCNGIEFETTEKVT
jgi:hypothetical protein